MAKPTPLHDAEANAGATFVEEAGWDIPLHFGNPEQEYQQAHQHAVVFDDSPRGKIVVAGKDALSFLHNLSTNDIAKLPINRGIEAFLATVKAKVVAHVHIYHRQSAAGQNEIWLDVAANSTDRVFKHLNHHWISEQIEITDRSADLAQLLVAGPEAHSSLQAALQIQLPSLSDGQLFEASGIWQIRRDDQYGIPGYAVLGPIAEASKIWECLQQAGVRPAGKMSLEILRVEAGYPREGVDLDENTLVMEVDRTAQAVCYTKGCYLGQEPIVRARDLGHVNRKLRGLKINGSGAVAPGSKLMRDGQPAGQVTSSVVSPRLGAALALAYVRRGSETAGTKVEIDGEPMRSAEVSSLPFGA